MAAIAAHQQPMTTIKLSGPLIKLFGRTHRRQLETGSVSEAFSSLRNTLEGFEAAIRKLGRSGMCFAIFKNRRNAGVEEFTSAGSQEIRIVPVVEGSKRAGAMQVVLGVALIALAWWNPLTWSVATASLVTSAGIATAAGGVLQLLSPQLAGLSQSASPENLPSYAFGSAKNTTASGNPVPICIGERRWGGAIVSASIYAEDKS
jgi:predicted phage tail protein